MFRRIKVQINHRFIFIFSTNLDSLLNKRSQIPTYQINSTRQGCIYDSLTPFRRPWHTFVQ